ncbi:hypothetical protein BJV78DRAFT_1286464 [Lactifluus subvellereus]|nr:hypothetical protein BJV78DRAFT_1286464 [Lactifluus subvellereus]
MFNLFNPAVSHLQFLDPLQPSAAFDTWIIPSSIRPSFKKLRNPDPKSLGESEGFFKRSRLFKICEGLELWLMSDGEREALLRPTLLPTSAIHIVLPALFTPLHTRNHFLSVHHLAGDPTLRVYFVKPVSSLIPEAVVKLFVNQDRDAYGAGDALPEFTDKVRLSDRVGKDLAAHPHSKQRSDMVPVIRETTMKAISVFKFSDKLIERILNSDIFCHLARLQSDPESPICINSIILIGRLDLTLGHNTRHEVLGAACAKALKGSFPPTRVAALVAYMACANLFEVEEFAGMVVGLVAGALVLFLEDLQKKLDGVAAWRTLPRTDDRSTYPLLISVLHPLIAPASLSYTQGSPNAVSVGWGDAPDDEDPWGAFEDPTPPPVPILVAELTSPLPPAGRPLALTASARRRWHRLRRAGTQRRLVLLQRRFL